MIRATLIATALATGASASPMEREAGGVHVYTPDMTLGEAMDLGWMPEPQMEVTGVCPSAWHYRQDWHEFCGRKADQIVTEVEWPKLPTPMELLYGPGFAPASSPFVYYGLGSVDQNTGAVRSGGFWGWGSSGTSSRFSDRSMVTIFERRVVVNNWPPELPEEPAPVPLPASWLMMLAGLIFLRGVKR